MGETVLTVAIVALGAVLAVVLAALGVRLVDRLIPVPDGSAGPQVVGGDGTGLYRAKVTTNSGPHDVYVMADSMSLALDKLQDEQSGRVEALHHLGKASCLVR